MKTSRILIIGALIVVIVTATLAISGIQLTQGFSKPSKTMFAKQSLQLLSFFGHYSAPHMLASMKLFNPESSKEDQQEGFVFLKNEAENGSCYSTGKLGWAYQKGLGVEANLQKAIGLYEDAAKCGMTYWQILLSHAYKEGYLGFNASEEKAKFWKEMEPKIHTAIYECWVSIYYQDGTFPQNQDKALKYEKLCESEPK